MPLLQIEDFLNGKSPLSVAIRVGESVVVVNLHRAKVEEIEMEPPPTKRRCVGPRQIAVNDFDYPDTGPSSCSSLRHLNTNQSSNELLDRSEHTSHAGIQRRSSRLLERSIRSTRGVSPVSVCEPAPVLLSEPLPKVQDVERQSSIAALVSDPALANTLDEPATSTSPKKRTNDYKHYYRNKYSHKGKTKATSHYQSHGESSKVECMSPLVSNSTKSSADKVNRSPIREGADSKRRSVSRAVQTELESTDTKHHKTSKYREVKLPDNGISMKRKAVMDAISEILKKMYANSEKGRLPGSFKGRFSSEFTCDSGMHEILHSKTTMTSYGGELDSKHFRGGCSSEPPAHEGPLMSKAKFKENQLLKDKVAQIKWKMQHNRAIRKAKRQGERSACGWMEALNCSMPPEPPKERETFGGLKPGFLLSDSSRV